MIILGNGASGFQPPTSIAFLGASGVIKVGDLTGDGFADLIVGIVSPTGTSCDSTSVMAAADSPRRPYGWRWTDGSPVVGDLDSDGDIDLVWPREGGGIVIQLNNGSGTFVTTIYLATPPVSLPRCRFQQRRAAGHRRAARWGVPEPGARFPEHVRSASGRSRGNAPGTDHSSGRGR